MIDEDASNADRGTLENTKMVGVLFVLVCKFVTPPLPRSQAMDALNGNATDLTQFNATLMELRRDLCLLSFSVFFVLFSLPPHRKLRPTTPAVP